MPLPNSRGHVSSNTSNPRSFRVRWASRSARATCLLCFASASKARCIAPEPRELATSSACLHDETPGIETVSMPVRAVATSALSSPSVNLTTLISSSSCIGMCTCEPGPGPPYFVELR
jgi:hypothetical protein